MSLNTIFNYVQDNHSQPAKLNKWLVENHSKLRNKSIFYVIKANMDRKPLYKIGIVTSHGTNDAYYRLLKYVHTYDQESDSDDDDESLAQRTQRKANEVKGVKLYLILGNNYSHKVQKTNKAVTKLEKNVLNSLRSKVDPTRGNERIEISIKDLMNEIDSSANVRDTETQQHPRESRHH